MSDGKTLRRVQPGEAVPPDAIDVLGLARRIASSGPRGAISASSREISALAESVLELIHLVYLTGELVAFERDDESGDIPAIDRSQYFHIFKALETDLIAMGFLQQKDGRHEVH